MAKRKRKKRRDEFEYFYFTVDDWSREYRFEINRHRWEFSPDHHAERDAIMIAGRLRTKTRRKITSGEFHLFPSHVQRDRFSDEADRIGNSWIKEGRLYCGAFIPADAYYSLPTILALGKFVEMTARVRNLRYNRGCTDEIGLDFQPTDLEKEDVASLPDEPVGIRPLY